MTDTRSTVIETIADTLVEHALALPSRVQRVAVIGITANGKSTLAEELAQTLARRGRSCINIAVCLLAFYLNCLSR
jgi:polynucleotide 5'-kinase involved in rRNA processing